MSSKKKHAHKPPSGSTHTGSTQKVTSASTHKTSLVSTHKPPSGSTHKPPYNHHQVSHINQDIQKTILIIVNQILYHHKYI